MLLVELSVRGVRGFSSAARVGLRPGFWLLQPPVSEAHFVLPLIFSLLQPRGRGEDAAFAAQPGAKAALTFQGRHRAVYRIVREFGRGGVLELWDASAQRFVLVSADAQQIEQLLHAQAGVPSAGVIQELLTLRCEQLPSQRRRAASPHEARPAGSAGHIFQGALCPPALGVGEQERGERLAKLEAELGLVTELEALQFQLDGLSYELDAARGILQRADELRARVGEVEQRIAHAPSTGRLGLAPDVVDRCRRLPQLQAKRDEALAQLELEGAPVPERTAVGQPELALHKDARILGACALGVLCLVAGALLSGMGRYVALLDIPVFGVAGMLALRRVDDARREESARRREAILAARRAKIVAAFEAEEAPVAHAQRVLGVTTPGEVIAALEQKAQLEAERESLRRHLAQVEGSPDWQAAVSRSAVVREEQEALATKLSQAATGYMRSPQEIERDIAEVRAASAAADAEETRRSEAPSDPPFAEALLGRMEDFLPGVFPAGLQGLGARAAQYVSALTEAACEALTVDPHGHVAVVWGGEHIEVQRLPLPVQDAVYLALRLTLFESLCSRGPLPLLVEDGLLKDSTKLTLLGRLLNGLGASGQVLWVGVNPTLVPLAQGTQTL